MTQITVNSKMMSQRHNVSHFNDLTDQTAAFTRGDYRNGIQRAFIHVLLTEEHCIISRFLSAVANMDQKFFFLFKVPQIIY